MDKGLSGDIIQLYYFDNSKYHTLTKQQTECIYSLKNKVLNDLPLIGSFCDSKCTMKDIVIKGEMVYFKFLFEVEIIKHQDGKPVKYLSPLVVESKNFLNKGISAIICTKEIKYEKVLSIINGIPSFVNLKLNPGFQFKYTLPSFKEINFQEDKLLYIRAFFENKDIKKNAIINCDGSIYALCPIEESMFNDIVDLIYILYKVPKISESLRSMDSIIKEYLSLIHLDAAIDLRIKQTAIIEENLKSMIERITGSEITGSVYITIILNILISLCKRDKIETDYCIKVDPTSYLSLTDFLKNYTKNKFRVELKEQQIIDIMCKVSNLIQLSQGDEEKLVSLYKRN